VGEHVVARVGDIPDRGRIIVELEGRSIGVFNIGGEFFALRNRCLHQGGEVCTGGLFPAVKAEILSSGRIREYFDHDQVFVACPWHGWEYDVRTGRCVFDPKRRLVTFQTKVRDGHVVVVVR
jgi:nitrite reductase/ring-hydroxylating ferredoxin subunit